MPAIYVRVIIQSEVAENRANVFVERGELAGVAGCQHHIFRPRGSPSAEAVEDMVAWLCDRAGLDEPRAQPATQVEPAAAPVAQAARNVQ